MALTQIDQHRSTPAPFLLFTALGNVVVQMNGETQARRDNKHRPDPSGHHYESETLLWRAILFSVWVRLVDTIHRCAKVQHVNFCHSRVVVHG